MSFFRRQAIAAAGGAAELDPYYPFLIADIRPNGAGTAMIDHSPYGWTVSEVGAGAITYDTAKATFDGTNYLTVDVDPALLSPGDVSQMTIEVSCSAGTAATAQYFVYAGTTSSQVWSVAAYVGNAESYRNNGSGGTVTGAALSNGTRVDLKLLVNKTAGLLLSDNVPNSASSYAAATFGAGTIDKLYIGESPTAAPVLTSGSEIYRVRIYRGVLRHPIAVPTEAFVNDPDTECLVSFDGADGATSATDESGNAHSLTFASGFELDTAEKHFGTASLLCPISGTGVRYTRSAAKNTNDFTNECFYKATAVNAAYQSIGGDNLYNAGESYTWYRFGSLPVNWEPSFTGFGLPVFTDIEFRHHVWQRHNNIMLHWAGGELVNFYSQTTSFSATVASIGGNNTSLGAYGWIDEWRDSTIARYTPTLMRDETLPGGLPADNPANVFAQTAYIGTGSSKSLNFAAFDASTGALSLVKNRGVASRSNVVTDTERGATQTIYTDATTAEATQATYVTSFDSDGITVGSGSLVNENTYLHSADVFAATRSASVTVDSQSLTLKHSGKGFGMIEIDRALGGASASISIDISGMGLASAPMVWVKNCDSVTNWAVWHPSLTSGYYLLLNSNAAEVNTTAANFFGNNSTTVDPTATTITLGNNTAVGGSGVDRIIVYIFGEVSTDDAENYIKLINVSHTSGVDSYVDCGWHPRFSVVKSAAGTGSWVVRNSTRGEGRGIFLDSSAAEQPASGSQGQHGPFGLPISGANYAVTGTIIGFAAR